MKFKLVPKKKMEEGNSGQNFMKENYETENGNNPNLTAKTRHGTAGVLHSSRLKSNVAKKGNATARHQDDDKYGKKVKTASSEKAKMDTGKNGTKQHANTKARNLVDQEYARARFISDKLAKVVKSSGLLADLITSEDRVGNISVIREAKHAFHRHYDPLGKEWFESPDHKTRLAAATLQLAYDEGTPVQRQVILSASFDSADKTIAKIKESPELLKAIQALQGVGLTLENGAGEAIDIESEELK